MYASRRGDPHPQKTRSPRHINHRILPHHECHSTHQQELGTGVTYRVSSSTALGPLASGRRGVIVLDWGPMSDFGGHPVGRYAGGWKGKSGIHRCSIQFHTFAIQLEPPQSYFFTILGSNSTRQIRHTHTRANHRDPNTPFLRSLTNKMTR